MGCSFKGFDTLQAPVGGRRSSVNGFSSAARRRLLVMFSKMDWQPGTLAVFMTLTYPAEFPSPREAKKHLRALMERYRRAFPESSAIWRLEFQARGAPHFHLVWFGLPFIPKETVQKLWGEVIAYAKPFTRVEAIRSRRKLISYVGKYVAKVDARSTASAASPDANAGLLPDDASAPGATGASGGFNLRAYLHALPDGSFSFVHPQTGELCGSVGRWWGVHNKEKLPMAAPIEVSCLDLAVVYRFRRGARKSWPGVSRRRHQGFSLFVDGAERWHEFYQFCLRP